VRKQVRLKDGILTCYYEWAYVLPWGGGDVEWGIFEWLPRRCPM
jgi:hypothetical protein